MRVFAGIVLGVFLTIGFAYVYDASTTPEPTTQSGIQPRPMVNWDVVNSNWHGWSSSVRNTWNKLASR